MSNVTALTPITSSRTGILSEAAYIIVICLAVLIVVLTISFTCYLFRLHFLSISTYNLSRQRASPIAIAGAGAAEVAAGLDDRIIATYPKLKYSKVKQSSGRDSTAGSSCCPICLADYKDDDTLLLLPDCAHFFHFSCVDPWLRVRPTCPVCRKSPVGVSPAVPARLQNPENFVSNDVV